jgi:5-methylcytosine-specific restriction endonuclease McrA
MPYKDPAQERAYHKAWQIANRGKVLASAARWRATHREKARAASARWNAANQEKVAANQARSRAANRERDAANVARWKAENPERVVADLAHRRAMKLRATPAWANQDLIYSFYRMAKVFGMEVDHIIPLISKKVCGLHSEHNLQLLTKGENSRKRNKFQQ